MNSHRHLLTIIATTAMSLNITAQSTAPHVETTPFIARGATKALARSTVTGSGIKEEGYCWALHKQPTIEDSKTTEYYERRGKLFRIEGLTPASTYYMRAYAIGSDGAVGYGNIVKVVTLPLGNTAYTYNANDATADQSARIRAALEEVVQLYNEWQGLRGLHITCNYSSGTPTADCSYGGWMRMGANASYQRTGTILHETNHAVGVGTTSMWKNNPNLRAETSRGIWLGERANQMVRFLENDESVSVTGDNTHMWATGGSPLAYGINGAQEDTGNPLQYIGNVLITHALGEDGLTPTNYYDNGYPYYSVDIDDDVKYYIKPTVETLGLYTSYMAQNELGSIVLTDTPNDSAAWYISFDANAGKYIFRNAATGRYLTHTSINFRDVLRANNVSNPGTPQMFQLTPTRHDLTVGNPWNSYTDRPVNFWFESWNGMTTDGTTVTPVAVDGSDAATAQHWYILSENQKDSFQEMVSAMTIDNILINDTPFQQFNTQRTEYIVGCNALTTPDDIQLSIQLNPRYNGTATISQTTHFPGTATVTLIAPDGTQTPYTFHFVENLIPTWDAGTTTGTSSKANRWGWDGENTTSITWGNANGINTHYMDPGMGSTMKYENYTFEGRPYNLHRMLTLSYTDKQERYSYTLTALQPSTTYDITLGLGWYTTDATTTPQVTLTLTEDGQPTAVTHTVTLTASALTIAPSRLTFTTSSTVSASTRYALTIDCTGNTRIVLADLCLSTAEAHTPTADVNHDGTVDTQDVLQIYQYMQAPPVTPAATTPEDVNHDGTVDTQDVLSVYETMVSGN